MHRNFRHQKRLAFRARAALAHWFAVLFLVVLSGLAWQRLHAATVSKLSVSAIVVTRCSVVVSIADGAPVVSNTCGASPAGSVDGRASIAISPREHLIQVQY